MICVTTLRNVLNEGMNVIGAKLKLDEFRLFVVLKAKIGRCENIETQAEALLKSTTPSSFSQFLSIKQQMADEGTIFMYQEEIERKMALISEYQAKMENTQAQSSGHFMTMATLKKHLDFAVEQCLSSELICTINDKLSVVQSSESQIEDLLKIKRLSETDH